MNTKQTDIKQLRQQTMERFKQTLDWLSNKQTDQQTKNQQITDRIKQSWFNKSRRDASLKQTLATNKQRVSKAAAQRSATNKQSRSKDQTNKRMQSSSVS